MLGLNIVLGNAMVFGFLAILYLHCLICADILYIIMLGGKDFNFLVKYVSKDVKLS